VVRRDGFSVSRMCWLLVCDVRIRLFLREGVDSQTQVLAARASGIVTWFFQGWVAGAVAWSVVLRLQVETSGTCGRFVSLCMSVCPPPASYVYIRCGE
jgi:hypothetical protein